MFSYFCHTWIFRLWLACYISLLNHRLISWVQNPLSSDLLNSCLYCNVQNKLRNRIAKLLQSANYVMTTVHHPSILHRYWLLEMLRLALSSSEIPISWKQYKAPSFCVLVFNNYLISWCVIAFAVQKCIVANHYCTCHNKIQVAILDTTCCFWLLQYITIYRDFIDTGIMVLSQHISIVSTYHGWHRYDTTLVYIFMKWQWTVQNSTLMSRHNSKWKQFCRLKFI